MAAIEIAKAFVEFTARRAKKFDDVARQVQEQTKKVTKEASASAAANTTAGKSAAKAWDEMVTAGAKAAETAEGVAAAGEAAGAGVGAAGAGAAAAAGPIGILIAGVAALSMGLGKMLPYIHKTADELKAMKVAADVAGFSVEELTATAYAMERAGGSLSEFLSLRDAWNSQAVDLQYGSGRAGAAMRYLGVNVRDAKGQFKDLETVLPELARAMKDFSHADQKRLADAIFGGGADGFLKIIAQGEQGLNRMKATAAALGTTTNDATARAGAQLSDTWGTLSDELTALWRNLVGTVAPVLIPVLVQLIAALTVINRLLSAINDVFLRPLNYLIDRAFKLFAYIALLEEKGKERVKQVFDPLGVWGKAQEFWGGAAADNKTAKSLDPNAMSQLSGGSFGAQLTGLSDFARNMVQAAAGRIGVGEAQLKELKTQTQYLAQIAGDSSLGGLQVAP